MHHPDERKHSAHEPRRHTTIAAGRAERAAGVAHESEARHAQHSHHAGHDRAGGDQEENDVHGTGMKVPKADGSVTVTI